MRISLHLTCALALAAAGCGQGQISGPASPSPARSVSTASRWKAGRSHSCQPGVKGPPPVVRS